MKFEIARLNQGAAGSQWPGSRSSGPQWPWLNPRPRRCPVRILGRWRRLPAPAAAARRTMTVEERLQKLEGMNQRLLEQNQQLTHELKAVTRKVNAPDPPGVQRRIIPVVQPPAGDTNAPATQPTTGSAVGGGDLMARAERRGRPPDLSGDGAASAPTSSGPSRARRAAAGGQDLISFDERDTHGIEATGRFGRRFVNNGLWFSSPNKNFQFHVGGRVQLDAVWVYGGQYRSVRPQRDRQAPRRRRPPPPTPPVRRGDVREYAVRRRN